MDEPRVDDDGAERAQPDNGQPWQPQPTIPADPPKLLPGTTAWAYSKRYINCLIPGSIGVMGVGIADLQAKSLPGFLIPAGVAWGVVWLGLAYRFQYLSYRATKREVAAGYTTKFDEYLHRNGYQLWHLDPKSGAVMRAPGETKFRPKPDRQIDSK